MHNLDPVADVPRAPVDELAERLFNDARTEAHAYIRRISQTPNAQSATEARLGFEIGVLHSHLRQMCYRALLAESQVQRLQDVLKSRPAPEDDDFSEAHEFGQAMRAEARELQESGAAWELRA